MVNRSAMWVGLDASGNGMTPSDGRRVLAAQFGTTPRPLLPPSATLSSSNMQVTVAQNVWQLPDPTDAAQTFLSPMDAFTVTPAAGAASTRIDSITIKQDDPQNSATDPYSVVTLIAGTPGSGAPAIPAGSYEAARITVPAGASTASACTVQFMNASGLLPGPLQAAAVSGLPTGAAVGQRASVGALDYRWNGTGWDLQPGTATMTHLRWSSATNPTATANGWTDIPVDTVVYDPQGLRTSGTQYGITLPWAGRWSFFVRCAVTADDTTGRYVLAMYNVSGGSVMSARGQYGIVAVNPMEHYTEEVLGAGTVVKPQLYRNTTGAQFLQAAPGSVGVANVPEFIARYLGPA